MTPASAAPIGVFDSGVGGLSILQALRQRMPQEHFVYLADSAHAPYGERDASFVQARAQHILQFLHGEHQVKALVVACNTATALAIQALRQTLPDLPILGVEPAVKPAALLSQTQRVGVMATPATLQSVKFQTLLKGLDTGTEFVLQGCEGLADAIEQQWQRSDNTEVVQLCQNHLRSMGVFGTAPGQIDTLVLGCTHYPFALNELRSLVGETVQIVDNGEPVARHTQKVLKDQGLAALSGSGGIALFATGETANLQHAADMWLGHAAQPVCQAQV
jgi:glutamate racemase